MRTKLFVALLAICFSVAAIAQVKKPAPIKDGKKYLTVLQSTVEPALVNGAEEDPGNLYKFFVTWKTSEIPKTFFWRGTGGWMTCNVVKAKRTGTTAIRKKKKHTTYTYTPDTESVSFSNVHKNDVLCLIPMKGGKYPVPPEIPRNAKNTIFFQTPTSGWIAAPVKVIIKKPASGN